MKSPLYLLFFLGLVFFFVGCGSSTPEASETTKSPSELVKSAIALTDDFKFCLADEAGIDSLSQSAGRLHEIVDALPKSVTDSELTDSKKAQVSKAVESVKTACDSLTTAIDSQATTSELSKANAKIRSELISISKLSL